VFVKSIAGCPPQKSNLYAGSERWIAPAEGVTIKIILTGYHSGDVTFKMYFGGYSVTLLSYAAIYLIWGSTYLAIRLAIDSIPPLLMMCVRCVAAGTLLLAWAAAHGERAGWRTWRHALVAGALMFGCAYGALAWAETRLASGVAAPALVLAS
jgi:hypothetical protein